MDSELRDPERLPNVCVDLLAAISVKNERIGTHTDERYPVNHLRVLLSILLKSVIPLHFSCCAVTYPDLE